MDIVTNTKMRFRKEQWKQIIRRRKKRINPIQISRNKVKVRQPKTKREMVTHGLPEEELILKV